MTLTKTTVQEDDTDSIFGPPKEHPTNFFKRRSKVPMISAQFRLREVKKRILQMSLDKLDKIKDSERNLRRSVLIHEVYCRLTNDNLYDEKSRITNDSLYEDIRREKQNRFMLKHNIDKSDSDSDEPNSKKKRTSCQSSSNSSNIENYCNNQQQATNYVEMDNNSSKECGGSSSSCSTKTSSNINIENSKLSCSDSDLEKLLDPEFISNPSNLDPEITNSAEQLEQILEENLSRKRKLNDASVCGMNLNMTEEENDRLVKEALSQFYLPATHLLSAIEELPLLTQQEKRQKLDLNIDLNQNSYIQVI